MTTNQSIHDPANLEPPTNPLRLREEDGSASEYERISDNEGTFDHTQSNGEEAEEVVGFSIGQKQDYMKSAQTPAAEKAQAIDRNAEDYFDTEAVEGKQADLDGQPTSHPGLLPHQVRPGEGTQDNRTLEALPSPWNPGQAFQQRSAATRTFLAEGFTSLRRRASSGPSNLTDNIRRLISDIPILSLPKNSNFTNFNFGNRLREDGTAGQTARSRRSATMFVDGKSSPREPSQSHNEYKNGRSPSMARIATASSPQAAAPDRQLLRRSTSDTSLYLTRGLSHTTTLDDTSQWDDVSEQVNSRFKAITDSFQDSRIRLPKVPSINFPSFRPSLGERPNSENTRENMQLGATSRNGAVGKANMRSNDMPTAKTLLAKPDITNPENRAHPIMAKALSGLTGDVIVLGGYRGSILRSAKPPHRQLWVPVKVGLNLRKVDLEVGLDPEDEERMEETIFPSGVLSHIGPVDICRRLLRHLRKCPNTKSNKLRVHDYGYDWRLSPHLSSRKFLEFVQKLQCNQPGKPVDQRGVTVIAHSLGGLITRHAVNIRPELFAGVVYAGVPQRCVNILGPLRNGDAVLLSSRVLTAQVNFTMRTSYALLPEDGRCFIDKNTGERYDVDFFDVRTWHEYRLSPCIRPPVPAAPLEHRKSLIDVLSDSLPSLPNSTKRASWGFGAREVSPERGRETTMDKAKDAISNTTENAAHAASDLANPESSPPSLEPTMGQTYHSGSISTTCTIPRDQAFNYLQRTLSGVRVFKQELTFRPEHESNNAYPPLAYMFGKSVPTVYGARVASREAIKYTDAYDDLAFAAGDGVVLASAAMLPKGYRCVKGGRVETERGHVGLLGDMEGVGQALQAVVDARAKGVGMGIAYPTASADPFIHKKDNT